MEDRAISQAELIHELTDITETDSDALRVRDIIDIIKQLPSVTPQSKTEKIIKMRDATPEERESIDKYIKSISKPTGIDFDSLSDSQTIHHLTDKTYSELCLLAEKGREALQTNSDAISREAVIERLKKEDKILYTTTGLNYLIRAIRELPSVKPQEPKWIPVSERLPELLEDVLMCDNGADIRVGYYRNGHYANGREYFEWYSYDKDDYDFEPIAWMPLPQPYKESEG